MDGGRRRWWHSFGLTTYERRAIQLLTVLILAGTGIRIYSHHRLDRTLRIATAATAVVNPAADPVGIDDNFKIDLNRADAGTLEQLPGIGPVKARAIVEYRRANGPFNSPTDLERVPGIGAKTVNALVNHIYIGGRSQAVTTKTESPFDDRGGQ